MERMTKKVDGVWTALCKYGGSPHPVVTQETIDRLAAYEETGLEPEDIKQTFTEEIVLKLAGQALGVSSDRLRKLAKAEREGRCAVMPCEISHKLYDITGGEIVEKSIVFIPLLLTRTANHLSLSALDQRDAITAIVTQDIGNTVFLTRAEAEAALRREQDD